MIKKEKEVKSLLKENEGELEQKITRKGESLDG